MSVMNICLRRHPNAPDVPIKNKTPMIFHVGYRRYTAAPLFSEHTTGDKHLVRVASLFAIIILDASIYANIECHFMYSNNLRTDLLSTIFSCRICVGRRWYACEMWFVKSFYTLGEQRLLACGSVLSIDPDRLVIKRTILSGHAYRIHGRGCVSRYMFFNDEDINWFKPVELRTKQGRRGNIKCPVGE